jgi:hypothetical protein
MISLFHIRHELIFWQLLGQNLWKLQYGVLFLLTVNQKSLPRIRMKELEGGALDSPTIGIFGGQEICFDFLWARGGKGA